MLIDFVYIIFFWKSICIYNVILITLIWKKQQCESFWFVNICSVGALRICQYYKNGGKGKQYYRLNFKKIYWFIAGILITEYAITYSIIFDLMLMLIISILFGNRSGD